LVGLLTVCTVISVGEVSLVSLGTLDTVDCIFAVDIKLVTVGALIVVSVKVLVLGATLCTFCGSCIEVLGGAVTGNTSVLIIVIVFVGDLAPDTLFVES